MNEEDRLYELEHEDIGACPFGREERPLTSEDLTEEVRNWFGKALIQRRITYAEIKRRFGLHEDRVEHWVTKLKKGHHLYAKPGHQSYLDDLAKVQLKMDYQNKFYQKSVDTFALKVWEYGKDTARRRNLEPLDVSEPKQEYLHDLAGELDLHKGNGDESTKARKEATEDPYNWINFAAMLEFINYYFKDTLIFNADATNFTVGASQSDKTEVLYSGPRPANLKAEPSSISKTLVQHGVKYYYCISPIGAAADPVYVIADGTMPKDQFDAYSIRGFGIGDSLKSQGWIVFMHDRGGNDAFFRWYIETIVLPFVDLVRASDPDLKDRQAWYQIDGEQNHLKIFQDREFRVMLSDKKIVVGKPPASTSELTQPCDVGPSFITGKCKFWTFENVKLERIQRLEQTYTLKVKEVFVNHTAKFPQGKTRSTHMILGLIHIYAAFLEAGTPAKIVSSFEKCGMVPFNLFKTTNLWHGEISSELAQAVFARLSDLKNILMKNGKILDSELRKMQFPVKETPKDKDSRPLWGLRTTILNHEHVQFDEQQRIEKKHTKTPKRKRKEPKEPEQDKKKKKVENDENQAPVVRKSLNDYYC